jgi:hypothetical protein
VLATTPVEGSSPVVLDAVPEVSAFALVDEPVVSLEVPVVALALALVIAPLTAVGLLLLSSAPQASKRRQRRPGRTQILGLYMG